MSTIVTRAGKGSALTWAEMDTNLTNLNTDKAEVNSPTFTGTPSAPTAAGGTNTTQLATTAFVQGKTATQTPFTATGNIVATDVQAAIAEVDTKKVSKAGDTLVGQLNGITPVAAANLTRKDYVDGLFAKQTVLFRANKTNGQALPAGQTTTILFNQVIFDTNNGYNASTGEYTIQEDGLYLATTSIRMMQGSSNGELSGGGGFAGAGVLDGGAGFILAVALANTQYTPTSTIVAWCPAGTIFKTTVYAENAASVVTIANPNTLMSITRIG